MTVRSRTKLSISRHSRENIEIEEVAQILNFANPVMPAKNLQPLTMGLKLHGLVPHQSTSGTGSQDYC